MVHTFRTIAFLLATTAATTVFVRGQDQSASDADPDEPSAQQPGVEVEEYVFVEGSLPYVPGSNTIITRLPLDLRLTPSNVGVVTAPLFNEQFDRVVSDALVNVSNINIQTQNGVHDFLYIRGFDSLSSGLLLTDGAPEPEATLYQLYNVERVEVLKGPGGFLYGANPLAGAINLVRKQPVPANFFDFRVAAGSFENYEGSFDWNAGSVDKAVSFRLNGLFRDQGSHREGKGGRTGAINPSLTWQVDDTSSLNVNFEYMNADFIPDSGIPVLLDEIAPVDPDTNYQSPNDSSEQDVFRFQMDYQKVISSSITIRNKFFRRDLDWASAGTLLNGTFPSQFTEFSVQRTLLELDDHQDVTGNQFEAIFSFATGGVRHSLVTGVELARHADVFTLDLSLLPPVDLFDPVVPPGSGPIPFPGGFEGDARSIVVAPYVIDQIELGEHVQVLLGGRVDNIDFKDELNMRERKDSEFSPMVGILGAVNDELSIYGNFSRSFAPPSTRVIRVDELMPERSTQVEAGIKKRFGGLNADTTFAVYQLERDNIALVDETGFFQQIGSQRSRGFEIDFAAQPTSRSRTFFSYAFNDSELTEFTDAVLVSVDPPSLVILDYSGNQSAFAPKHILNFWISHDFASNWGIGGGGRYLSSQFIAEDNAFALDGVLTFDAMVFYRVGPAELRLNLRNVTDQEYYLRGFGGTSVIPAAPFSANFSVAVQM